MTAQAFHTLPQLPDTDPSRETRCLMGRHSESEPRRRQAWIILPAYNEERSLAPLLDRIEEAMGDDQLPFQVIVVDDGSTDRTAEVAEEAAQRMPLRVERHEVNQGLGATIRDGLLRGCELAEPRDFLITLDADNTHTPELILRMVRAVREGHDVVIASRFRSGSRIRGVSLMRRMFSFGASVLLRVLFPIRGVRDYTSGYRAYRAEVMQQTIKASGPEFFDQDGFQVMVDILLKLRRNNDLIFGEVPLILRYDMKDGSSKMDVGQTLRKTLALVVKRRLGR